jgi:predicted lysophospholipase L1 biosynthesis ABC-type transport system permease subunit
MPSPPIDTPQALDAAIAASRHARRDKLVRAVRNQRFRTRVAFGLSVCVALFALVAFFFAGDHEAAAIIAMMACVTFGVTYSAGKTGRKKAVDSLRETDQWM